MKINRIIINLACATALSASQVAAEGLSDRRAEAWDLTPTEYNINYSVMPGLLLGEGDSLADRKAHQRTATDIIAEIHQMYGPTAAGGVKTTSHNLESGIKPEHRGLTAHQRKRLVSGESVPGL